MGGCSEVDPIVASIFGGAMGVITSFMVVVEQCESTGAQALQILSWKKYLFLTPFGSSMCGVSGVLVPHMI